MCLFSTSFI